MVPNKKNQISTQMCWNLIAQKGVFKNVSSKSSGEKER